MPTFLEQVAQSIVDKHQQFNDVVVILPSQRAGVYFKKHLAETLQRTIISPEILTVQSFIQHYSGLELVDNFELLFECYSCYCSVSKEPDDFTTFLSWGSTLLADFNDVDHYMLDAQQVFSNLSQVKEIEEWSFNSEELSEGQQNFQRFWDLFYPIYQVLNNNLKAKQKAYQGQLTRSLAENLTQLEALKNKHIYIVGVNALTSAEEHILKHLKQNYNATLFWDNDSYYIDNRANEAGLFQRRYPNDWAPEIKTLDNHYFDQTKEITCYETTGNAAQVKTAGALLKQIANKKTTGTSAFVLADENLLIPAINSLPPTIDKANITMGYPAGQSPLFGFFTQLLELQEQFVATKKLHVQSVADVLQHAVLQHVFKPQHIANTIKQWRKSNVVYLALADITNNLKCPDEKEIEIVNLIFDTWKTIPKDCFSQWGKLINLLQENISNNIDRELLYLFSGILKQLENYTPYYKYINNLTVLKHFLVKQIGSANISFFGEPLHGLQIMGMLETRALDFDELIITSVNEGILPKGKKQMSLIPYDLKRHYNLPTHFEKDAIYAYHFYRLIQRAKTIHLIYNVDNDGFGKGEKSRFITQLELELNQPILTKVVDIPYTLKENDTNIQRTPKLTEQLSDYIKNKGLSPSAINKYIACNKNFVNQYILKIREPEATEELLKDNSIGSIIHKILEDSFKPLLNKIVTVEFCKAELKQVKKKVEEEFSKEFPYANLTSGENFLAINVAQQQLKAFYKRQIEEINQSEPITILGLEEEFELSLNNGSIKIKGTIDRVDRIGNTLRVLDYKTGSVMVEKLKLHNVDDSVYGLLSDKSDHDKVNQLLLYMFAKQFSGNEQNFEIISGIIGLNNIKNDLVFPLKTGKTPLVWNSDFHSDMEEAIKTLTEDMLNEQNKAYEHNPDSLFCLTC